MRYSRRKTAWLLVTTLVWAGCAAWQTPEPKEPSALPPSRLSADSVVLETVTFRLPWGEVSAEELWDHADEQRIDADRRRQLEANGFRVGVVCTRIPEVLTRYLDAEVGPEAQPLQDGDDFVTTPQTFRHRNGVPLIIAAPDTHDRLTFLRHSPDGTLRCEALKQAQCFLEVKPHPRGDSDLDLTIEPTVTTGERRQKFVPTDGNVLKYDFSPDKIHFSDLRFGIRLAPGESLVLTTTDPSRGLGEAFFTEAQSSGQLRQRIVLLRLAQTQQDDRFPLGNPTAHPQAAAEAL